MTILLVEDDPGIGRAVSRGLAAEGYDVLWLKSAREALAAARARRFDAVVLDLGLPDGDGLDVCGALKAGGVATPVLMLTAREALADKLDGFRAGADDYIAKPFAFEELLARLGVLVRRGRELQVQYVAAGALRLDLRSRRAECAGEDLALSAREFDLLAGLARRPGEVLSRQALLDEVWGEEALHTENAVDVYVSYLRRRLADRPGAPRIETIRGRGYRLAADAVAGRVIPQGMDAFPSSPTRPKKRPMNILLVGSGGREHALAWKIAQSPRVAALHVAPGNAGTGGLALAGGGHADNVPLEVHDIGGLAAFAGAEAIDLVVVGPEAPLAEGLADRLRADGIATFGPSAAAARLESSKAFSKEFMARCAIPTAQFGAFSDPTQAKAFLDRFAPPYVIKADGLAAGKGVAIAQTRADAEAEIDDMLGGRFGDSSRTVVIEEFMAGDEASFFALLDGQTAIPLAAAQDHKRAYDGDRGPNTGGMGAYSPTPALTDAQAGEVMARIVEPTAAGMAAEGAPYRGVLYVGLMMTDEGPKVVEYNVRFGDPECQILMRRMASDVVPYLLASATGGLAALPPVAWDPRPAVTVVMAARGYPGVVETGSIIRNVDKAQALDGVEVFIAGAAREDGKLIATGGRVLNVTAVGDTLEDAVARAYAGVDAIEWPDGFFRLDIAHRALGRAAANA